MNVLVTLYRGYGLGDAVQMSAVLKHLVKYRPDWHIDYQAEEGRHVVGRGIVRNTFAHEDRYPCDHYDRQYEIVLYDTWHGYRDRPNTRVSSCLDSIFNLHWDADYGRYQINVSPVTTMAVAALLDRDDLVAVHYQGDSAEHLKNLSHPQAGAICRSIERLGYTPLILDWRVRSPLPYYKLRSPSEWGRDAEFVTAVIKRCKAFVGIDSGPGKCASATDVPSLVVWTGHNPAAFHDPAPNTTHLIPPHCGFDDQTVADWFFAHYNVRRYGGYKDNTAGLVPSVIHWLEEVLT